MCYNYPQLLLLIKHILFIAFYFDFNYDNMYDNTLHERGRTSFARNNVTPLTFGNVVTNVSRTFLAGWYSWLVTIYSREISSFLAIGRFYWTLDFHTDIARRNPCRDAYARRNGHTIDVPLSPYIIRPIGQCNHAIFRIAITRDGRIRRGALHAELATSALRSSGKSKIPACVTRREAEWWLMPVSPRFSYLTYLDSMHRCI